MPQPTALYDFGAVHFGSRAQFDPARTERVGEEVRESGVRDLYVVVHGVHNDETAAASADDAFRRMLADAWDGGTHEVGVLGVHWPSLCFRDEGAPGLAQPQDGGAGITAATAEDLHRQ